MAYLGHDHIYSFENFIPDEDRKELLRFYDEGRDAFIPPKPYASWLLNEDTCLWESPVPYPTDVGTPENPKRYSWDEATTSWIEVTA